MSKRDATERGADTGSRVHFGGPDAAPGLLRDLLAERVALVPRGGSIEFVTYYFRDRRLAAALVAARGRGVDVRVTLDGHPRTRHANDAVIDLLEGADGLGAGLRCVVGPLDARPFGAILRPRLHEKLYCFSHPEPAAFVGSFNPSGDDPEDAPEVIREIGDHDRGYNTLVEIRAPDAVAALRGHARSLHRARHGPFDRIAAAAQRPLHCGNLTFHFWPRVTANPVVRYLRRIPRGGRVRLVTSHLSGPTALRILQGLARNGIVLEILVGGTARRVPPQGERRLADAGIPIARVLHDGGLPMHDKFVLVENGSERCAIFGSFNWSEPSQRLNREIGALTRDPAVWDAFAARWETLSERAQRSSA
jgi:phosphatidylserine/phosphatidylglycerophosphate/cardiolipin synthase-like enzyme